MTIDRLELGLCVGMLVVAVGPGCGGKGGGDGMATDTEAADTEADDDDDADETEGDGSGTKGSGSGDDSDTSDSGDDSDTGEPVDEPHALGTVLLGESHSALGGSSTPIVTAVFVPDAAAAVAACAEEIAGCRVSVIADCGGTCGYDEYCTFDSACQPVCEPYCDASCAAGEVCYFPSPGQAGCRKAESFDAGVLTFTNTTTPITLFPPYSFEGTTGGAPYAPGAEVTISATGATDAGFAAFERMFTATQLLQTGIDEISTAAAYGDGPIPVSWVAGQDDIQITVLATGLDGASGTVVCDADDAAGSFSVPRAAVDAATDGQAPTSISLTVTRRRVEMHKDLSTQGELLSATVQEAGWLELVTSSTESHSVQGCEYGQAICGESCVDISYDPDNCGDCGETCAASDECYGGDCVGPAACDTCVNQAANGSCKAEADACDASADCTDYLDCVEGCGTNTTCVYDCADTYPNGVSLAQAFASCFCYEACVNECQTVC